MAATTAGANGMTVQNIEISLWQELGGRSGHVDERQEYPVSSEILVIYGCVMVNSAENAWISPCYPVQ